MCIRDRDQVVPEEYTSYYRSVIAFGTVRILEDDDEIRRAIEALSVKYAPEDSPAGRDRVIDRAWDRLCILELTVDHMSGKQALELVKQD